MGIRSTGSTTISFGMVSIAVKIYTATKSHDPQFNTMHAECGSRVKQGKNHCPTCSKDVEPDDCVKGFEVTKGQYVTFTKQELEGLKPQKFERLDIEAFVPASTIDPIHFEKSIFIGPDKGADRAFNLLSKAMRGTEYCAIGRYMSRGKVYLTMLRPFGKGIMLHHLYYADEVRDYNEVDLGKDTAFDPREEQMAADLVKSLAKPKFDAADYADEYFENVSNAIDAKAKGNEVVMPAADAPKAGTIDLFEALKASLEASKSE